MTDHQAGQIILLLSGIETHARTTYPTQLSTGSFKKTIQHRTHSRLVADGRPEVSTGPSYHHHIRIDNT